MSRKSLYLTLDSNENQHNHGPFFTMHSTASNISRERTCLIGIFA